MNERLQIPLHDGTCSDLGADRSMDVAGLNYESLFDRVMGSIALVFFFATLALLLVMEPLLWEMTK